MPTGSASKARAAAALSPPTSMMSIDGAPRAKEMSCSEVMATQGTGPFALLFARPGGRSGRSAGVLGGPDAQDVPYRDHPEHLVALQHDQVAEPAPYHGR